MSLHVLTCFLKLFWVSVGNVQKSQFAAEKFGVLQEQHLSRGPPFNG